MQIATEDAKSTGVNEGFQLSTGTLTPMDSDFISLQHANKLELWPDNRHPLKANKPRPNLIHLYIVIIYAYTSIVSLYHASVCVCVCDLCVRIHVRTHLRAQSTCLPYKLPRKCIPLPRHVARKKLGVIFRGTAFSLFNVVVYSCHSFNFYNSKSFIWGGVNPENYPLDTGR